MLRQRILTAAVVLLVALAALFWFPNAAWSLFVALVTTIGAWEWGRLASWRPLVRIAYAAAIGASCIAIFTALSRHATVLQQERFDLTIFSVALVFWVCIALPWIAWRWRLRSPLALALAGWWVLVPAWLAATRMQLQPALLLALLVVVWIADTAAYFAGRRFGRNKLAPQVSPGKTWEGVAGAFLGVVIYFMVLGALRIPALPELLRWPVVAVFFAMTALGIVGDLFESWMKREAGVKDSGTLLPGHGGVLDRIDALTASLPLAGFAALTILAP
jgi:phosphatidate cytidylyltransferase